MAWIEHFFGFGVGLILGQNPDPELSYIQIRNKSFQTHHTGMGAKKSKISTRRALAARCQNHKKEKKQGREKSFKPRVI
jgi:hypothetical protein